MVLDEVIKDYDFNQEINTPLSELLGIEDQLPMAGIMDLVAMERFLDAH